jgi:hypothetical protein
VKITAVAASRVALIGTWGLARQSPLPPATAGTTTISAPSPVSPTATTGDGTTTNAVPVSAPQAIPTASRQPPRTRGRALPGRLDRRGSMGVMGIGARPSGTPGRAPAEHVA